MAKVDITVEDNEYALWDYTVHVNDVYVDTECNFTTYDGAVRAAEEKAKQWLSSKRSK